jgi:hypothetical protein
MVARDNRTSLATTQSDVRIHDHPFEWILWVADGVDRPTTFGRDS